MIAPERLVRAAHHIISVDVPPVPKARPRLGRGRIFTPRTTELAEQRIRQAWIDSAPPPPYSVPIAIQIEAWLARPRGHFGSGRNACQVRPSAPAFPMGKPDWDNLAKTVCDALNGVAYRDDSVIVCAHVWKLYVHQDRPTPGWRIGVWVLQDA